MTKYRDPGRLFDMIGSWECCPNNQFKSLHFWSMLIYWWGYGNFEIEFTPFFISWPTYPTPDLENHYSVVHSQDASVGKIYRKTSIWIIAHTHKPWNEHTCQNANLGRNYNNILNAAFLNATVYGNVIADQKTVWFMRSCRLLKCLYISIRYITPSNEVQLIDSSYLSYCVRWRVFPIRILNGLISIAIRIQHHCLMSAQIQLSNSNWDGEDLLLLWKSI